MILKVHQDKRFHADHDINFPIHGQIALKRYLNRSAQRAAFIGDKLVAGELSDIGRKSLFQICGFLLAYSTARGYIFHLCRDLCRSILLRLGQLSHTIG